MNKIKVFIVDDSAFVRMSFARLLQKYPDICVTGVAKDAYEARDCIVADKPDVLILDVQMPGIDGISFLKKIMAHYPLPVIICSSFTTENSRLAMEALEAGACEVIEKPSSAAKMLFFGHILAEKVKTAARHKIVITNTQNRFMQTGKDKLNLAIPIFIGSSTGGTRALEDIVKTLPNPFPPVVVVQHMPANFTRSFAQTLSHYTSLCVKEAENEEELAPGKILIAPGGFHLVLVKNQKKIICQIRSGPLINFQKPAVDVLFSAAAKLCPEGIGIILTGMGSDGAKGLKEMCEAGCYTIGQDEKTSVVYGMPKVAFEIGAVTEVLPLDRIPVRLVELLSR